MQLQDRGGGTPEYLAEQAQQFIDAARKRPEIGRVIDRSTAPACRRSTPTSTATRCSSSACRSRTSTPRSAPAGQLLRQRLQPLRPRLQGLRAGRAGVPPRPEAARPVLRAQRRRRMVPLDTLVATRPDHRPGVHQPLQPVPLRRDHRRAGAGLLLGAGARRPGGGGRARCCRRRWATSGRTCPTRREAPPAGPVFALAILLVFLVLAAQYESWALPFSVLLGTPFAAFGAFFGLWLARQFSAQLRQQRVRPDRR